MPTQGGVQQLTTLPLRRPTAIGQVQLFFYRAKPAGVTKIRAMPFGISGRRIMLLNMLKPRLGAWRGGRGRGALRGTGQENEEEGKQGGRALPRN